MKRIAGKLLPLLLLLFLTVLTVVSCTPPPEDEPNVPEGMCRVQIVTDDGAEVTDEKTATFLTEEGEDCEVKVRLKNGYLFRSAEGAEYDPETEILTVRNVTADMRINFLTEDLGYSTDVSYRYAFLGSEKDETSEEHGATLNAGTSVVVTAGDTDMIFVGWKFGNGDTIVSTDRVFTFRIQPAYASGQTVSIRPVYKEMNVYYYNANGGKVNPRSSAVQNSDYYSVTYDHVDTVTIRVKEVLARQMECAYTLSNDGTFTREGYVLKEFNTKADGTGTAYGCGSVVNYVINDTTSFLTLYCIWEKTAAPSEFTYTADGTGVGITGYTGKGKTLAVPETLNGKKVVSIRNGAFNGCEFETLILPRTLQSVENGSLQKCSSLTTLYFPDSVQFITNDAFDSDTYRNFRTFVMTSTGSARKYSSEWDSMAVKLSRLMASQEENRIVYVAGSSAYEGLCTEFYEDLLNERYRVVNFGTARTVNGAFFLEAIKEYTHDGDVVVFAPENSSMIWGETVLSWKTVSVLHGMYNLYRNVDMTRYSNLFAAYAEDRAKTSDATFEGLIMNNLGTTNRFGDAISNMSQRNLHTFDAGCAPFIDTYYITLNERVKSRFEGEWSNRDFQERNKDYTDPNNVTWCSVTDANIKNSLNRSIRLVKDSGAKVLFGFCPVDATEIVAPSYNRKTMRAYGKMIADNFEFDAVLGTAEDYLLNHCYFYNCAFHTNSWGRTYHTYNSYADLAAYLGLEVKSLTEYNFTRPYEGCQYESTPSGEPLHYIQDPIPEE